MEDSASTSSASSSDIELSIQGLFDDENDIVGHLPMAASQVLQRKIDNNQCRGRTPGSKNFKRGVCSWFADYLSETPVYSAARFRDVFRIPLKLYWRLHDEIVEEDSSFGQSRDAFGRAGHSSHQKILCSLRRLGNGLSFSQLDDMSRMSPESQREYFYKFLVAVVRRFGALFLNREPILGELRTIVGEYEDAGFPGCMGCIDCMHMHWKNCPKALKGQYHNPKDGKLATISCEALVDRNLYCWHWFSGRCGTNNDITVLDNSPLINDILAGNRTMTLPEGYLVNGARRSGLLYMLGDGIYPDWAIFVLPNHAPLNDREVHMTKRQEAVRKDVERFFGCLQGRFRIIRQERHEWSDTQLILISQVCVILHNMIVKMSLRGELSEELDENGVPQSESELLHEFFSFEGGETPDETTAVVGSASEERGLTYLLARDRLVANRETHIELKEALSHHLWSLRGGNTVDHS